MSGRIDEPDDDIASSFVDRLRSDNVVRWAMAVAGIVAVALAVRVVVSRWSDATALDLDLSLAPLATAVLAVIVANTLLAGSWGWLLARLGHPLPWRRALQIWWTGQLGTYLPTGLGSVPARVVLAGRHGVPRSVALVSTGLEPVAIVFVCAADAGLLLDGPAGPAVLILGLAAAVGVTALGLRAAQRRSSVISARPPLATAAGYLALQQAQVVVRAVGLWAGLAIVQPLARPSYWEVLAIVGASYLVGFLVVIAPGGLGAREATMTALLSSTTGATAAAAAAVLWRLLEVALVLPSVAISNFITRPRRPRPH